MVNSYFNPKYFQPNLGRMPSELNVRDLTTGVSYGVHVQSGFNVVFDPTDRGTANSHNTEYVKKHWGSNALIITGPYGTLFPAYSGNDEQPRRIGELVVDEKTGCLYPFSRNVVIIRRLPSGQTVVMQESKRGGKSVDAYSLYPHPDFCVESSLQDVCDLSNPRLGLTDIHANLIAGGDELLLGMRYHQRHDDYGLIYRGIDSETECDVYASITDLERLAKEFGQLPDQSPPNRRKEMRDVPKEWLWDDERLGNIQDRIRYKWFTLPDNTKVLWRTRIDLKPDTNGTFPDGKDMRFDETGMFIGPRLKINYLF